MNDLKLLSKTVLEGVRPPSGAYAFFNHNAHALSTLQDCNRILHRLFDGRTILTSLAHESEQVRPKNWPAGTPYPPEVNEVFNREGEANELMKLDLESLYIFGGILLDQIALQAIAVANLTCAKQHPFRELVDLLDCRRDTILEPLWVSTKENMLWLYYQLRFYRNRFIVHATRPCPLQ